MFRLKHSLFAPLSCRCSRSIHSWIPAEKRCVYIVCVALVLLGLIIVSLSHNETQPTKPLEVHVSAAHKKLVHEHVRRVLDGPCRRGGLRRSLSTRLGAAGNKTEPFLWRDVPFPDDLFCHQLPFGFSGVQAKAEQLQKLLPELKDQAKRAAAECHRCVLVGNGGVLRGLELGPLIDRFDSVIRLNSGPLGEFSADVGKRTSIRMSYPESTLHDWTDTEPQAVFITVLYKSVDISWMTAMIRKASVSLWDSMFFWQKVPEQLPVEPQRFRLLNPQVIREAAVDLLKYPPPRWRMWGWDQNLPTLGITALNMASLLCDQISLAGFGYNYSQQVVPLHYYDSLHMSVILGQTMHNVDTETELLRSLVKEGAITDLTGGIHCPFCSS